MDGMYAEASVKRSGSPMILFLRFIAVFAVIFTFMFAAVIGNQFVFVLGAALAFLVVWFWPRFNVEW